MVEQKAAQLQQALEVEVNEIKKIEQGKIK